MLASYNTTVSTANSDTTIFTTASGKETLVVGFRISGGANGGEVILKKNNGSSDVFSEKYTLSANDVLALDSKIAFPAGWTWKIRSSTTGVQIDVCADVVSIS